MSCIGSTERMRGTASKLFVGGGDWVYHSSVLPFHGSGPAIAPRLAERRALTIVTPMPAARVNERAAGRGGRVGGARGSAGGAGGGGGGGRVERGVVGGVAGVGEGGGVGHFGG